MPASTSRLSPMLYTAEPHLLDAPTETRLAEQSVRRRASSEPAVLPSGLSIEIQMDRRRSRQPKISTTSLNVGSRGYEAHSEGGSTQPVRSIDLAETHLGPTPAADSNGLVSDHVAPISLEEMEEILLNGPVPTASHVSVLPSEDEIKESLLKGPSPIACSESALPSQDEIEELQQNGALPTASR